MELIIDRKLTLNEIDQFLNSQRIYIYEKNISALGISSVDGKTVYIGVVSLKLTQKKYAQEVLEHELVHNLGRYFKPKNDIRFISPEKNKNLRIEWYMIEAGKFYDIKVDIVTKNDLKYQDPFTFLRKKKE